MLSSITKVAGPSVAQKVVIINSSSEILALLESMLDMDNYDYIVVESLEHAYSRVKKLQPNLVILCVKIDDVDAFQILTMLKLDEATRMIPVLTYTTEYEGQEEDEEDESDSGELEALNVSEPQNPLLKMN